MDNEYIVVVCYNRIHEGILILADSAEEAELYGKQTLSKLYSVDVVEVWWKASMEEPEVIKEIGLHNHCQRNPTCPESKQ